jgi:hypothetical protein
LHIQPLDKNTHVYHPFFPHLIPNLADTANISVLIAIFFILGSIMWIINGQYSMWPISNTNVASLTAFVGGSLFQIGGYMAFVEALNEPTQLNAAGSLQSVDTASLHKAPAHIGKALEQRMHYDEDIIKALYYNLSHDQGKEPSHGKKEQQWKWVGTEARRLGYWGALTQFIGTIFFTVAVISGLPGVISAGQWQLQQALIWTPQTVGSVFFVISSLIYMLEEQEEWWKMAWGRIAWHSGAWNLIGSIGFLLSAVFGFLANWEGNGPVCCQFWGTAFNTYYGSWAFLVASVLIYIEAMNPSLPSFGYYIQCIKDTVDGRRGRGENKEKEDDGGGDREAKDGTTTSYTK